MARIDHLAPYMHTSRTYVEGPMWERPKGACLSCGATLDGISNYNPTTAIVEDGRLLCNFCVIQLRQAETYGWQPAEEAPHIDNWNPWPPDDEQLSFVWDGATFWDHRATYQGLRR